MRFRASEAGPHWRGLQSLAEACERARLYVDQAEAARLASQDLPCGAIAVILSSLLQRPISRQAARWRAREAENRLRAAHPRLVARQRRKTRELLWAMRNAWPTNPGLAVYRERLGTHDREPVRFCSRLTGEVPEDLMEQPLRFLKDLPRLLEDEGRAVCD